MVVKFLTRKEIMKVSMKLGPDQELCSVCPFESDVAYIKLPASGVLRRINNMFHVDTEGYLVKSSNGQRVSDDEPVVILRARDRLALPTLRAYVRFAIEDNCTDWFLEQIDPPIKEFERFVHEHPERMKQPGITKGI